MQTHIHIGLHKTGSTYIQKTFASNRDALKAQGIDYPAVGAEYLSGHHNVAWSFIPKKAPVVTEGFSLDALTAYLSQSDAEHCILSSEDFEFLTHSQTSALRDLLADFSPKIVMYVRDPAEAVYSRWQEAVKHGSTTTLTAYCQQLLKNSNPLDYCKVADRWADVFGKSAVSIVVYDRLVAEGKDIALYFLTEILKLPIVPEQLAMLPGKVNPSSSVGVVEVLRQLNQVRQLHDHSHELTQPFMHFMRSHPQGQSLSQYLHAWQSNTAGQVDLVDLTRRLNRISEKFLLSHRSQTVNVGADESLFAQQKTISIPVVDSEDLAKKIDIKGLYKALVA